MHECDMIMREEGFNAVYRFAFQGGKNRRINSFM